jgi:hypothetical protein
MTMELLKHKVFTKDLINDGIKKGIFSYLGDFYEYSGKENLGTPLYSQKFLQICFKKFNNIYHKLTEKQISELKESEMVDYFKFSELIEKNNLNIYSYKIKCEKIYDGLELEKYSVFLSTENN